MRVSAWTLCRLRQGDYTRYKCGVRSVNSDDIMRTYRKKTEGFRSSRYDNCDVVVQRDGTEFRESFEKLNVEVSGRDKYHVVLAGEKNRLDIISYKYYGTPLMYWIIAEANEINNPTMIEPGTVIRIPDLSRMYSKGVVNY